MWQLVVVGLVLAVVLVAVGRHFARALKGSESPCSCCSGSCPSAKGGRKPPESGVMASGCCGDTLDRFDGGRPS